MLVLPVIFLFAALFIPNGYAIKCNACQATPQSPNDCQNATEVTCPVPFDRCFTARGRMEMNIPSVGVVSANVEIRNCSLSAMMCTESGRDQMCQQLNSTGDLKSCNYSCCEGDLCNDGTNPPDSGLMPSPASNISCYECSPEGMGPGGEGTPLISCSAPKQRKCGDIYPGVPYDRCMTVKVLVKNQTSGALVNQEYRNCSQSTVMCNTDMVCNNMNSTGELATCNVQCCEGSLCNSVSTQPTTGPSSSGPKGGQTPLAVSGILVILSIALALLFK